jgi:RNA polymerase sigma factor (sigma-70 family)
MPTQIDEVVQYLRSTALRQEEAELTDGQLLERYLEGRHQAAVAALVRRHGRMVWGVCRRILPNHHDAEDAFQATFLVLVRKAASIASKELVANWMYGVARKTALKARATAARRRTRERQVTAMPEPQAVAEGQEHDLQPFLDHELSRLPEKYRVALVLCDLDGKTRKEAAGQLGVPEGTVAGRLARARVMLAKQLARHGRAVSGGALAAALAPSGASASVPPAVVSSTIQAAALFAAGPAAAGVLSVKVAALAEGVLKTMVWNKLKGVLVVLVLLGATLAGVSRCLLPTPAAEKGTEPAIALKTEGAKKAADDTSPRRLERAWSLEGPWTGVVGDARQGTIYTIGRGQCVELDLAGKKQRTIKIAEDSGSLLRMATWRGDGGKALLTFSVWSAELRAYDLSGKQLWSYPRADGIDDVWARDLQGDGSEEVIVGYNGGTGLHVLDARGKLLWKSTAIGNVWHVCAGDVLGEGKRQVVTTSAAGKVHLFDAAGKRRKDLDAGCYASMVRCGKLSDQDQAATILVAGPALGAGGNPKTVILARMSGAGAKTWSLQLPAGSPPSVYSAQLAPHQPWLAVGMQGGPVHIVDIEKGKIIASVKDQGLIPEVAWVSGTDAGTPLLLVATGSQLNAYRVTKSK